MTDTLKQLGKTLGNSYRDVDFLNSRGGLLPQLERTRGSLHSKNSFIAHFTVGQPIRRLSIKLVFYKSSIL